jgi:hypothetical protein
MEENMRRNWGRNDEKGDNIEHERRNFKGRRI